MGSRNTPEQKSGAARDKKCGKKRFPAQKWRSGRAEAQKQTMTARAPNQRSTGRRQKHSEADEPKTCAPKRKSAEAEAQQRGRGPKNHPQTQKHETLLPEPLSMHSGSRLRSLAFLPGLSHRFFSSSASLRFCFSPAPFLLLRFSASELFRWSRKRLRPVRDSSR